MNTDGHRQARPDSIGVYRRSLVVAIGREPACLSAHQ